MDNINRLQIQKQLSIEDTSNDHVYTFGVSELTLDRTIILPLLTGNDIFVFENHIQTLTNKTINTASNTITIATADVISGTFADTRIVASNVTQHEGSITIGNLTGAPIGAVVGISDVQTLTNKTLTATTNNVVAKSLHSATTTIDVSSATAPTSGQVLTATSGTMATWQSAGNINIDAQHAVSTTTTSTTSSTYVDMDTMTLTTSNTSATTYQLTFSCTIRNSATNSYIYIILNIDGVDLPATNRSIYIKTAGANRNLATSCLAVNLANAKIIKIRYKTDGGTLSVYDRALTIFGVY
jgi:hypothetical protein